MQRIDNALFVILLMIAVITKPNFACTNIIVTHSASDDGTVLIGDNDDTAKRDGGVTHFEAAVWPPGSTRDIYDFETSVYVGVIAQPAKSVRRFIS